MKNFKNKEEFTDWVLNQFTKYDYDPWVITILLVMLLLVLVFPLIRLILF